MSEFVYLLVESPGYCDDYSEVILGAYYSKKKADMVVDILKAQEEERVKFEDQLEALNFDKNPGYYGRNFYSVKETRIFDYYEYDEDEDPEDKTYV